MFGKTTIIMSAVALLYIVYNSQMCKIYLQLLTVYSYKSYKYWVIYHE